jgi:hypothetical protein
MLCVFWLALADQVDRARNLLERAAPFANDLGLLPRRSTQRPVSYSASLS